MASQTDVANLALMHIGVGIELDDLDTDASAEARAVRKVYDNARDAVLRDFPWPFATKIEALGLVEEFTGDTDEWGFSYRYPSDCVKLRRLKSGIRNDSRSTRVVFKESRDSAGQLILTDIEDAEAEYTMRVDVADGYPPDFAMALSFRIAYLIRPSLAAGNAAFTAAELWAQYQAELTNAQRNAANEEQSEDPPESEFIRARN